MAQMANGQIPSFMNHLESGQINLESGTDVNVSLTNIAMPKGIFIYSNAFDLDTAKADKPMLGAYIALYIAGTDELTLTSNNVYNLHVFSMYAVNWGQNVDSQNPAWRASRTESRGIYWFRPSTRVFNLRGFGSGEYDFKNGVTYNWIAWD